MKAFTQDTYGSADVMRSREVGRPEIGDEQVLVRVRAAGVNPADWAVMRGLPYIARPVYGLRRPKVGTRGTDVSGIVETVGSGVTRFKPGDEVFGSADGSYAEYAVAFENQLVPKPANLTFEQAAAAPMAGQVAILALRGVEAGHQHECSRDGNSCESCRGRDSSDSVDRGGVMTAAPATLESPAALRLRRRRGPMDPARQRLRLAAGHRPVSALQPGVAAPLARLGTSWRSQVLPSGSANVAYDQ